MHREGPAAVCSVFVLPASRVRNPHLPLPCSPLSSCCSLALDLVSNGRSDGTISAKQRPIFADIAIGNCKALRYSHGFPYSRVIKGRLLDFVASSVPAVRTRGALANASRTAYTVPPHLPMS
jgi:hypothetical protein